MTALLPQLPDSAALPLLAELARSAEEAYSGGTGELRHPQAFPLPTGGLPVQEASLRELRERIIGAAEDHGFPGLKPRSFLAFELRVAEILAGWSPLWTEGAPSGESMRNACWTFLTVEVLPDVAIWRWPPSDDGEISKAWKGRMLGGGRNTFQRIFRRVLSLDRGPSHPDRWGLIRDLREDDFSNILERPSLGSNQHIAVCLAEEYLAMRARLADLSSDTQMKVYREATKDLRAYGVVQALDLLPRQDLEELIRQTFLNRESAQAAGEPGPVPSPPDESPGPVGSSAPPVSSAFPDGSSEPAARTKTRPPGLLRRLFGDG
jgi:hypothetical protein